MRVGPGGGGGVCWGAPAASKVTGVPPGGVNVPPFGKPCWGPALLKGAHCVKSVPGHTSIGWTLT